MATSANYSLTSPSPRRGVYAAAGEEALSNMDVDAFMGEGGGLCQLKGRGAKRSSTLITSPTDAPPTQRRRATGGGEMPPPTLGTTPRDVGGVAGNARGPQEADRMSAATGATSDNTLFLVYIKGREGSNITGPIRKR